MAYNSINTYDARSVIPEFKGLLQYGDTINADPRYATDAENMETIGGTLQPAAKCQVLTPELDHPIETLARLYRRWYTGADEKEVLIAASDGQLYYMLPSADAWTLLDLPDAWVDTAYASNVWSWVAYEINPEGSESPVDVLLMSNALDGMIMIRGDDYSVAIVTTPKKFGVIERYAERIWGGAIIDDPDMLVYSAPFDPTDWAADTEIPEDGAGDISQPSWDGDSFTALRAFGSQLIAFKKNRVWRILGTDPGEYTFKEQFGGGSPYFNTIAVDSERIFLLDKTGVMVYDGLTVQAFYQAFAKEIFSRMNQEFLAQSCAVLWHGKYYCAFPLDTSETNNAVLIYSTDDNTWLLRTDISVESFLAAEDNLYFTSTATPGQIWLWAENSWETEEATTGDTIWTSPWNDLGYKNYTKSNFDVYFTVECFGTAQITFSLETEKKVKTKTYSGVGTDAEAKQKRMHFGGSGRRFRLKIESTGGALWRVVGGILIVSEIDPD